MTDKLRKKILELAEKVGEEKTICPSEVARALWPDDWLPHMEEIRAVAVELRDEGEIEISQKGIPVRESQFTGPIRLRIISRSTS